MLGALGAVFVLAALFLANKASGGGSPLTLPPAPNTQPAPQSSPPPGTIDAKKPTVTERAAADGAEVGEDAAVVAA